MKIAAELAQTNMYIFEKLFLNKIVITIFVVSRNSTLKSKHFTQVFTKIVLYIREAIEARKSMSPLYFTLAITFVSSNCFKI